MAKRFSLVAWFFYNLRVISTQFLIYYPLRSTMQIPAKFTPTAGWAMFVFGFVILLITYLPVFFFLIIYMNTGKPPYGLLIATAFGVFFGTWTRFVVGNMMNYVIVDRRTVTYVVLGFKQMKEEIFDRNDLLGLVMIKRKYKGTKNFKICLQFGDGRLLMIYLTTFSNKAEKRLTQYQQLLNLELSTTFNSKLLINESNISRGRT